MANNIYMVKHIVCPNCGAYMSYFGVLISHHSVVITYSCECSNLIKVSVTYNREDDGSWQKNQPTSKT